MQLAIVLLCVPLAGVIFFLPSSPTGNEQRGEEDIQKEYRRLEEQLRTLQQGEGGETAARVLTLLKEARLQQLRRHPTEAFALYHRVRVEIESDLGGPLDPRPLPEEVGKTLREVRDFVNQELINLGASGRRRPAS